jgi:hypothetical protein
MTPKERRQVKREFFMVYNAFYMGVFEALGYLPDADDESIAELIRLTWKCDVRSRRSLSSPLLWAHEFSRVIARTAAEMWRADQPIDLRSFASNSRTLLERR